jgi:hypothetical protein
VGEDCSDCWRGRDWSRLRFERLENGRFQRIGEESVWSRLEFELRWVKLDWICMFHPANGHHVI